MRWIQLLVANDEADELDAKAKKLQKDNPERFN